MAGRVNLIQADAVAAGLNPAADRETDTAFP
jgi:hypothetical protein